MKYREAGRLYCFSPPVMIATFVIEVSLALYVIWKYKLTPVTRLAVGILLLLAVFQLAEYNICEGALGIDSLGWSRLGYVAITLLPPLGIHLSLTMAGVRSRALIAGAYASAVVFAGFFLLSSHGITSPACLGNYVIFQTAPGAAELYVLYYYGWLFVGTGLCMHFARQLQSTKPHIARAQQALAIGYLAFIVPTTFANVIDPTTIKGIPSIMCGFAVLLAIILAGEVLPKYFRHASLTQSMGYKTGGRHEKTHP